MDARIRIVYAMVRCTYVCMYVRMCVGTDMCTYSCVYAFICVLVYVLIGSMYVYDSPYVCV